MEFCKKLCVAFAVTPSKLSWKLEKPITYDPRVQQPILTFASHRVHVGLSYNPQIVMERLSLVLFLSFLIPEGESCKQPNSASWKMMGYSVLCKLLCYPQHYIPYLGNSLSVCCSSKGYWEPQVPGKLCILCCAQSFPVLSWTVVGLEL